MGLQLARAATLGLAAALFATTFSFTVTVQPAAKEECFYREVFETAEVKVHFAVPEDPIAVRVYGVKGQLLHSQDHTYHGNFEFKAAETGAYKVCLSSNRHRRHPLHVHLRIMIVGEEISIDDLAEKHLLHGAEKMCLGLIGVSQKIMHSVYSFDDVSLLRDQAVRKTQRLAKRFAGVECVVAILIAVAQVIYTKRLLFSPARRSSRMV